MKKLLLLGLFGLGIAATPVLHAEKTFVQVQYPEQLFDGGRYVMAAVNNSDTYKTDDVMIPRVWYLNGTTAAAKSHAGANSAEFSDDMVWVFKADTSYPVCGKTGHAAQHGEGKVFHIGREIEGEMQYIVQCSGDNLINGSAASLNLSATANDLTATEFVVMPEHANFTGEQLFALSGGWTGSVFQGARVVSNEGKFDRMSNADINVFNVISNQWSAAHRVFIELDSENIDNAIHYYWITKMREIADSWSADVPDAAASKELRDAILAIATPELEWDYATIETQVSDYVNSDAFRASLSDVVSTWIVGKVVTFKNVSKGRYLCTSTTDTWSVGSRNEIGASSYWTVEQAEGGLKFKTTQGNYITANLGIDTNADNAALITLRVQNATSKACWISPASNLGNWLHSNGQEATSAEAIWVGGTSNGAISQWYIHGVDFASRFAAKAEEIEDAVTQMSSFQRAGIFTADDVNAVTAALRAIDITVPSDLSTAEDKLASITEQIVAAGAAAWAGLNDKLFYAHNDRRDCYMTVVEGNSLQAVTAVLDAQAIWQLKHVEGETFKFYNPSTGTYISANNATTSNADDAIVFALEVYNNTKVLFRNTALTVDNRYLHKNNVDNGIIWFNKNDAASAFNFVRGAQNIVSVYASNAGVPKVGTTFLSRVADTQFPALYNDVQEMLSQEVGETYSDIAAAIKSIDASIEAMNDYGFYVTLTPLSPDNVGGYKFHYTASRHHSTNQVVVLDDNTETESNAIWMYKNGKFLNYSNGYHMELGKNAKANFIGFCNSAADNNGGAVKIYNGHQDETAVQLVFASNRNLHFHNYTSNQTTHFAINVCGTDGTHGDAYHNVRVDVVTQLPVEIHQDGYATFSSPLAVKFADASVDVYTEVMTNPEDMKFKFAQVSDPANTVIAPNTPVILHGAAGSTVYATIDYSYVSEAAAAALAEEAEEEESVEALKINGSSQLATVHTAAEGYTTYVKNSAASFDDSLNVPFVKVNSGDELPVNAMLLTVNNQNTSVVQENKDNAIITLNHEYTTGIEEIELVNTDGTTIIFDLMGRRLSEPVKGVNIINGKKVLVK